MVVEGVEEDEPEEEELLPADDAAQPAPATLEEVLQAEVEVLAPELQQLEDEGSVEPQFLEELEKGVEAAAESLVTMREAHRRSEERPRLWKTGTGKPKLHSNQTSAKKATTRRTAVKAEGQGQHQWSGQTGHSDRSSGHRACH